MSTLDELRATAHPIRLQLLSLLTGTAMSAAEAGRELRLSQATASYHLRVLERASLISVVQVVRVRGGEAKRYRHEASARPFRLGESSTAGRAAHGAEERAQYIEAITDELRRRSASRAAGGPHVTTDAELWVDPQVWDRVVTLVGGASALLHVEARAPRTPGTVPVSMTAALFPLTRP